MTKGKETSTVNKDGIPAGTKDAIATKGGAPEKPAEGPKAKVESKPKTEMELAREEVTALKTQLKKLTDDEQEWKEKYVYLQAEFDNAEKRRAKAMDGQRKRMQADLIFAFLPLVDSFIPAVKNAEKNADVKQLGEGLKTLKQQLDSILKGLNVTPIDQVNVPFDYNLHDVTISQEQSDVPDDTVLSIVQVGWKLGSDVIRPAKVVVSKKPVPPAPSPAPADKGVVDLEQAKIAPPKAGKQSPAKMDEDTKEGKK